MNILKTRLLKPSILEWFSMALVLASLGSSAYADCTYYIDEATGLQIIVCLDANQQPESRLACLYFIGDAAYCEAMFAE